MPFIFISEYAPHFPNLVFRKGTMRGERRSDGGERMRVLEYVLHRKRRVEEGHQKEGERAYGA